MFNSFKGKAKAIADISVQKAGAAVSSSSSKIQELFDQNYPKIEPIIINGLLKISKEKIKDDKLLNTVFDKGYEILPFPVRLIISKARFLEFTMTHRDSLLQKVMTLKNQRNEKLSDKEISGQNAFIEQKENDIMQSKIEGGSIMSKDVDSDKFFEFFKTVLVNSEFIKRDPDDFAKCWHPDLVRCMDIAKEKGKLYELKDALEHKLAALNLSEADKHAEAIDEFRKAADVFPFDSHFKFLMALGYMENNEVGNAAHLLEGVLSENPTNMEAIRHLSRCCYLLDDVDRAIVLLQECMTIESDPEMFMEMGGYCCSKGEIVAKEICRRLGRYDQERVAEVAAPYLERAIKSFQQCPNAQERFSPQYFNKLYQMYDQLIPGRLQDMSIPLSLNRLYRVNTLVDDMPEPMMDAEFVPKKNVHSALVASCVRGNSAGDYTATVFLFDGDDPTQSRQPVNMMTIVMYPDESPTVSLM